MGGFHGKCLRIDLTTEEFSVTTLDKDVLYSYLGGRGIGAYIFNKEVYSDFEPLNEKAPIVLSVGPLTGTKIPTSGRSSMTFKSPLTGLINDSNAGGKFGTSLKACGFDTVVIQGRSKKLMLLNITPLGVEFIPAENLKQKTTDETHNYLQKKLGVTCSTACIGPAGENGVLYASVAVDGHRNFGRGGGGAVWGSKNIKAIAVKGNIPTSIYDKEKYDFFHYEMEKQLLANPITSKALPEFGTAVLVNVMNSQGILPSKNFQENFSLDALNISGEELTDRYLHKKSACQHCPIACGRVVKIDSKIGAGPEYETIYALGAMCGIYDLEAIIKANLLCNALGLDTISTGVTIACAMEMHEKGYLSDKIKFGDINTQYELIKDIALRKGIGNELAKGSKKFAALYEHPEFAMQVKGLELPAYDPRGSQSQGLAYATSNRGGCHLRANMTSPEILGIPKMIDRDAVHGKAGLLIVMQHTSAIFDSLVLCKFAGYAIGDEFLARILTAVSGIDFEPMHLQIIGERIWNTERIVNLKFGLNPEREDTLPNRLLKEFTKDGPSAGKVVNLTPMLEEYYRFRSWTIDGIPTQAKLDELGL